ncbi:MAG: ATPase [Candidatus Pelagibacter sp. TMED273]|nr:MAG: ATPase [Candidatus Pelagibacter sp. TMED273]
MNKTIKIANGQGFWGDSIDAPYNLIKYGDIDYLTLDYLAEVTLSIMQRQKLKNPKKGYATDFVDLIKRVISDILEKDIKIVTNAGGVNPEVCRDELLNLSFELGLDLKIAIIKGDDILNHIDLLQTKGVNFDNMDDNSSFDNIKKNVYSANAYINSFSISDALKTGANIILAGRVSDPGLVLGPAIYEFGWKIDDYDKLAAGTLAGHILECGAQCSGGNFTDWKNIPNLDNVGYPVAILSDDTTFQITKPKNTGGKINRYTIIEQVLYEMGDPKNYISPDVVVDFTSFSINEINNDIVEISGVKGYPATDTYKVSINYFNGYKASGQLTISGPNALEKAQFTSELIWKRLKNAGISFDDYLTEYLGVSSCHGNKIKEYKSNSNEVVIRLSVRDIDKSKVIRFGKELAPVITSGPPGVTGFSGGRPRPQEIIAFWPCLINKKHINIEVVE